MPTVAKRPMHNNDGIKQGRDHAILPLHLHGLDPSDIVLDGDQAPPPKNGEEEPPNLQLMSIVAKRQD